MTERACAQCVASNNVGRTQCKRKTCKYGPKCWQHTNVQDGLLVGKSQLPNAGNGLYTLKKRKKGEDIAEYKGKVMTKQQLDRKYPGNTQAKYAIKFKGGRSGKKNMYIDAAKTNCGVARYANEANIARANNTELVQKGRKVVLEAKKDIKPKRRRVGGKEKKATELFTAYGDKYW